MAGESVLIEHGPDFLAAPLKDHPFERVIGLEQFFDLIGRRNRF